MALWHPRPPPPPSNKPKHRTSRQSAQPPPPPVLHSARRSPDARSSAKVVVLGAGTFFGEIAMLSDTERTATIMTKTYCHVLVLNKSDFQSVSEQFSDSMASIKDLAQSRVEALMKRQEQERRTLLGKVPIFTEAIKDAEFLEMMVKSLQSKVFAPETFICHRGLCPPPPPRPHPLDAFADVEQISSGPLASQGPFWHHLGISRGTPRLDPSFQADFPPYFDASWIHPNSFPAKTEQGTWCLLLIDFLCETSFLSVHCCSPFQGFWHMVFEF